MWDPAHGDSCRVCQQYSRTCKMNCDQMEGPYLDKENLQPFNSMKTEELSLYDSGHAQRAHCRRPLEEHDSNSLDSGYGASYHGEKFLSYASPSKATMDSFTSMYSMEDEFLDFTVTEASNSTSAVLPQDFNKLISDPLMPMPQQDDSASKDATMRPVFRRSLSLQSYHDTPPGTHRVRTSLFKTDDGKPFKRPEPPNDVDMCGVKRSRMFDDDGEASVPVNRPAIHRTMSATEESIMSAVQRSDAVPDLIGDFSKPFVLPLTASRHQDLKAITTHTLAELMRGQFTGSIGSFKIIDCRYPYEFEGGHIEGALNIYTKEQCMRFLNDSHEAVDPNSRHILIFHCEFSSERGPNLYRFLRKEDRNKNASAYPFLVYPEMYLLEGGYKMFFQHYSNLCTPIGYKEMSHPDHEEDFRHFRQKSKTWNQDCRKWNGKVVSKRVGM